MRLLYIHIETNILAVICVHNIYFQVLSQAEYI